MQGGVVGLVAGYIQVGAGLAQLSLGRIETTLYRVVLGAADDLALQQCLMTIQLGAGQLVVRLGGGKTGTGRIQLQVHIIGIEGGQHIALADAIAHIHLALADLAGNTKAQLRLVAGADFARENILTGPGGQRLDHQRRTRRFGFP